MHDQRRDGDAGKVSELGPPSPERRLVVPLSGLGTVRRSLGGGLGKLTTNPGTVRLAPGAHRPEEPIHLVLGRLSKELLTEAGIRVRAHRRDQGERSNSFAMPQAQVNDHHASHRQANGMG